MSDSSDDDDLEHFSLEERPFSHALTNILSAHVSDIRRQTDSPTASLSDISKRRIRDLVKKYNSDILGFLKRPDRTPCAMDWAERIFRRFGHADYATRTPGGSRGDCGRDLNLDPTMTAIREEMNRAFGATCRGASVEKFVAQMKWIYGQYKDVGEEIMRLEDEIRRRAENLDKLSARAKMLTGLPAHESLPPVLESFETYAQRMFEESDIAGLYRDVSAAYKRWQVLHDIISLHKTVTQDPRALEPTCSICLVEPVSMTVVPCGHVFCGTCVKKMHATCYVCRAGVRERVKIFFS